MSRAAPEAIVMHPGPINRGVEIMGDVADGAASVILEQVSNGVAVRMAVLYLLAGGAEKLLLKGGRVIDPASGLDEVADVLIDKGRIAGDRAGPLRRRRRGARPDGQGASARASSTCTSTCASRGRNGRRRSRRGRARRRRAGSPAWRACPTPCPSNDTRSVTELIVAQARQQGAVAVYPIGCVTKGQAGKELAEMGDMVDAGAVAFSDDGKPVASAQLMRRALEYSRIFDVPIIDHCEEPTLVDGGVVHEGEVSTRMGLKGWPGVAEDVMVQRDILLAEYTGGHVHIAHMSTGRSAIVRAAKAKKRGIKVTCEVTPHHLFLTHEAVDGYDTNAKMNPPLRPEEDRAGAAPRRWRTERWTPSPPITRPTTPTRSASSSPWRPSGSSAWRRRCRLCLDGWCTGDSCRCRAW